MLLADFHIHSTFSDGKLTIPQIVDLYGMHGFGAIAITDHVSESATVIGRAAVSLGLSLSPALFPLYLEILKSEARRAWKEYKMIVLPGVELSKNSISNQRSAHILALGVKNFLSADGDVVEILKNIRNDGALSIAAHPVSSGKIEKQTYHLWNRRAELQNLIDAWEVASGSIMFDEVLRTKLPKIANSDFHSMKHFRSWKTLVECERHPEAILDAIRKQKIRYHFYHDSSNAHAFPVARDKRAHDTWHLLSSTPSEKKVIESR